MRIYSMRATFGKLEQACLTFEPGLNVIQAPNEWGKSTWCAFLVAMLYGIDTRAKTTRSQLADKERFRPWSGCAMEGSIDLNWNGRDITIERWTKGRIPMGEFRAFETASGLNVPELTAENCGHRLLGVEKEVFTRAGFLRFSDLPVTEDEQLRRRLNDLVTTGDESGSGQLLEEKLKELKNRCRYNRNGLIPQARQQKELLEQKIEEHHSLSRQSQEIAQEISQLEQQIRRLQNHQTALQHTAGRDAEETLLQAQADRDQARQAFQTLQVRTAALPTKEEAQIRLGELSQLKQEQLIPPSPVSSAARPSAPQGFEGLTAHHALLQARQHRHEINALVPKCRVLKVIFAILGICLLLVAPVLFFFLDEIAGLIAALASLSSLLTSLIMQKRKNRYWQQLNQMTRHYGTDDPDQWVLAAEEYATLWQAYIDGTNAYPFHQVSTQEETPLPQSPAMAGFGSLGSALDHWNGVLRLWEEYAQAQTAWQQAEHHLQALNTVAVVAPPAPEVDLLTHSKEQTEQMLLEAQAELRQLLSRQGQFLGQLEALGSLDAMEQQNAALEQRLFQLEQLYAASELALKSLEQATAQLQRRFAPRIADRAGQILSRLTLGRYRHISLDEDFSLQTGAENETVQRSAQWRSDGTVDQLYLALRLAVAQELTPQAPLILDDALVRFDDRRLQAALEVLQDEAQHKQVIVFTCQDREKALLHQ